MYPKVFLLLFLSFCLSSAYADTLEIKGKITLSGGNLPPIIALHSYDDMTDITAKVSGSGTFTLRLPIDGATQYNLRLPQTSYDIMLAPQEKEVSISITIAGDKLRNIRIDKSKENEAYRLLADTVIFYDSKLKRHFIDCEKESACERGLHEILQEYKTVLTVIQDKYKGTYTADVLCKMKMPVVAKDVKRTSEEFRAGYFDQVPFADESILGNSVYKDMIDAYVEFVAEPRLSKEEAFIKDLMAHAKINQKIFTKTASLLYETLFRRSKEKMLGIFITWYNANKVEVANPVLETKVANLTKSMTGAQYTNIIREDVSGVQKSLKEVIAKSNGTLLIFWSSDCSHCREEMPYVMEMYEKYHSKGLNIYAVSLEQDREKWAAYIKENKLDWTNVPNLQNTGDNPAVEYMVMFTPTIIVIDKEGVIQHRLTPKNKLEKYIKEVLK